MTETPEPLPPYQWQEGTIKGSEKFFDFLKGEQDRLVNKLRVGDERARSNGTTALAAAGIVTLTRSAAPTLPDWTLLVFLALALVVLTLTAAIIFNRTTTAIKPESLWQERTDLWNDERSYMEIMQFYQAGMIENIAQYDKLQRVKYKLLDWQNGVLALLIALLVTLLAWAASTLK